MCLCVCVCGDSHGRSYISLDILTCISPTRVKGEKEQFKICTTGLEEEKKNVYFKDEWSFLLEVGHFNLTMVPIAHR